MSCRSEARGLPRVRTGQGEPRASRESGFADALDDGGAQGKRRCTRWRRISDAGHIRDRHRRRLKVVPSKPRLRRLSTDRSADRGGVNVSSSMTKIGSFTVMIRVTPSLSLRATHQIALRRKRLGAGSTGPLQIRPSRDRRSRSGIGWQQSRRPARSNSGFPRVPRTALRSCSRRKSANSRCNSLRLRSVRCPPR